jgi:hypothetical protein
MLITIKYVSDEWGARSSKSCLKRPSSISQQKTVGYRTAYFKSRRNMLASTVVTAA